MYKKVETINEFIDLIRIRVDVFIIEKKCPPGWEPDELDKDCIHFIVIKDGEIIGTVRLYEKSKDIAKLGRMAVKKEYRGQGIGSGLIEYFIEEAKKLGYKKIVIQAQEYVKELYSKAGFKLISSEAYYIPGLDILHVDMELEL